MYSSLLTSDVIPGTITTRPCLTGHTVYNMVTTRFIKPVSMLKLQGYMKFIILVYPVFWEEYQVVKRGRKYQGYGEGYKIDKREKRIPYNIKAVGKNIKLGRREEDGKSRKKMRLGKNIKL